MMFDIDKVKLDEEKDEYSPGARRCIYGANFGFVLELVSKPVFIIKDIRSFFESIYWSLSIRLLRERETT